MPRKKAIVAPQNELVTLDKYLAEEEERQKKLLPHLYGRKFYKWSRAFIESTNRINILCGANQSSKALADDTEIPTPGGYKKMGDLKIGDCVYGQDGNLTRIVDIPFKGEDECYRFVYADGSEVVSSKDHAWICKTSEERFRKTHHRGWSRKNNPNGIWKNESYDKWTQKTTSQIIANGKYEPEAKSAYTRASFPIAFPIKKTPQELPLDPYLVGILLGDGGFTSSSVIVTSADEEITEYLKSEHGAKYNGKLAYRLNGYQKHLRQLGLMGLGSYYKFIPEQYLNSSIADRMALLQGLMDTDGSIGKRSGIYFATVSPRLRDGIVELVSSLGGTAEVRVREAGYKKNGVYKRCLDCYNVIIKIRDCPFRLKRKAERFYKTRYKYERVLYRVEPVGRRKATCITVDNADGSFLCTRKHLVTHNSSSLIRRAVYRATATEKWKEWWPSTPRVFWYLYPDLNLGTAEIMDKWIPEWLPRGDMKSDPKYGWRLVKSQTKKGQVHGIEFKSGVMLYLRSYTQSEEGLQASSVHEMLLDEELPLDGGLFDELMFRGNAPTIQGTFNMAYTPTLAQPYWRAVVEGRGEHELLPKAFKQQISLYDCLEYEDGSPGAFTREYIENEVIPKCKSKNEILKRVYGKHVTDEGNMYPTFKEERHYIPDAPIPQDWSIYAAVDIGGGGEGGKKGHRAAIAFIAVNPAKTEGRVCKFWISTMKQIVTAGDIFNKFIEMKRTLGRSISRQAYDWQAKDFHTIAENAGEGFERAEKGQMIGQDMMNTLFQYNVLKIMGRMPPESQIGLSCTDELIHQFENLKASTQKSVADDDGVDAVRYAAMLVPWDLSTVMETFHKEILLAQLDEQERKKVEEATINDRQAFYKGTGIWKRDHEIDAEFSEINELLGT